MYKTPHKGKGKGHTGQGYTYGISKKEGIKRDTERGSHLDPTTFLKVGEKVKT